MPPVAGEEIAALGGPAPLRSRWVSGAVVEMPVVVSVAVIVEVPHDRRRRDRRHVGARRRAGGGVRDGLPVGDVIVTVSPVAGWPCASVTVTVAVDCELPLAMIELGSSASDDLRSPGRASVSASRCPRSAWSGVLSVAVIVTVADRRAGRDGGGVGPVRSRGRGARLRSVPDDANETVWPEIGLPLVSVTVAVAVEVDVPLAMTELGESDTVTAVAGPAVWVSVLRPTSRRRPR